MPVSYRQGTTWRQMIAIHYNQGGAWRNIRAAWYNQGGTWRQVFASVRLSSRTVSSITSVVFDPPFTTSAGDTVSVQLLNTGVLRTTGSSFGTSDIAGEWLGAGAASAYDVRATLVSGTSPSGSALGAWLNLATSRSWSLTSGVSGSPGTQTLSCVLTIEIRPAGGGAVLATANITLSSQTNLTF